METLGKYIEALLEENDCVVLPSFGAFIAYTNPAYYVDNEHSFFPPTRSLCFNRELTTDDGLLTSYFMKKKGVSFSEARDSVNVYVDRLRDILGIDGAAKLSGIGRLRQDLAGNIHFEPSPSGVSAPSFFGLDALTIRDLTALEKERQGNQVEPARPRKIITRTERTIDIHVGRQTLRRMASVAAVLLLLILFALPVNDGKYTDIASLGITAVSMPPAEEMPAPLSMANPSNPSCPASFDSPSSPSSLSSSSSPSSPSSQATPTKPTNGRVYHVIVGSLPSQKGADAVVQKYVDKGFEQTTIVMGDDRVRISIAQFTEKTEGEAFVESLRQDEAFKHVWLLSVKAK